MKNSIYLSALFFTIIFISSCGDCPHCSKAKYDFTSHLQDTISKAKYDLWVSNWKTYGQSYTAGTLTDYFTMPTIDLEEFLQHPGTGQDTVAAARFVLGIDINGTDTIPHLVLVGVNSAGESMTDASRHQYIYDVTLPCPNACGVSSLPN